MSKSYTKRSDSTQLPSADELIDILKKESQRVALRYDFIQKNLSIFDAHRELSRKASADDSWIHEYKTLDLTTLVSKINDNHSKIAAYITDHPEENDLYERFYASLVPSDDLHPSESLFVFGAASNARVERAVELYKLGVAGTLILSGKGPHYSDSEHTEARRMAAFALENGVPESALIIEDRSITLPDNVKCSIDLLESMAWRPKSITLIATNFVLMRATMEWYKFCPWDITIRTVAAHPQSNNFTEAGWSKRKDTIALVLNEYAKLILESKIDVMRNEGL